MSAVGTPGTIDSDLKQNKERSWLYYLAEISLRRMIMDTVEIMYGENTSASLPNLPSLLDRYDECSQKLHLWYGQSSAGSFSPQIS